MQGGWCEMKPAIDQMIAWLEGEMASYPKPASYIDKGYRALEVAKTQALKIKDRCDADDAAALVMVDVTKPYYGHGS